MEADPAEEACGELIPGGEGDIDVLVREGFWYRASPSWQHHQPRRTD
jgi:hypothetical protein